MDIIKVGITGGIGSGKTTVCNVFNSLGIPIYSSDDNAKRLINTDSTLMNVYKKYFGQDIYSSGVLNTKKVSEIIFSNRNVLNEIEKYVHKAVRLDFDKWTSNQNSRIIINEAAIMFESGGYKNMDKVITVVAPKELRLKRVMKRSNMSEDEVLRIMDIQWNDKQKIDKSDFVIYADDKNLVIPQVLDILDDINSKML